MPDLTPEMLLAAYAAGFFPMAERAEDPEIFWVDPDRRGILPLEAPHIPRRLARTVRQGRFTVRVDTAFAQVVAGCAEAAPGRSSTWINTTIAEAYAGLFRLGHAHCVETWIEPGGEPPLLAGGLYGVSIGGAFFGESMFSRVTDASKVAFVHLLARLRAGGYVLLDTQFVTDHLARFGTVEIPRTAYRRRLAAALRVAARWDVDPAPALSALLAAPPAAPLAQGAPP